MGKLLLSAALLTLGVLGPMVLERVLSDAPESVWRMICVGVVVLGAVGVISSRPVVPLLRHFAQHKLAASSVVIGVSLCVGLGIWWALAYTTTLAEVLPARIESPLEDWNRHHPFAVHNRTQDTLYAIWIGIEVQRLDDVARQDLMKIDMYASDGRKFGPPSSPIDTPPEGFMFAGQNGAGLDSMFVVLRSLPPRGSFGFEMVVRAGTGAPKPPLAMKFSLEVLGASRKPDEFSVLDGNARAAFKAMPKGLNIDKDVILVLE